MQNPNAQAGIQTFEEHDLTYCLIQARSKYTEVFRVKLV